MKVIGYKYAVAVICAASGIIYGAAGESGTDASTSQVRVDLMKGENRVRSLLPRQIENIKFKRTRAGYVGLDVATPEGERLDLRFADFDRVRFTPVESGSRFPITYKVDYNIDFDPGAADAAAGEWCTFSSGHWYVPSALHVTGEYTGFDYATVDGFLLEGLMPDCYCPGEYRFMMPFEPVTVEIREWERTLYNGIAMPEVWPPAMDHNSIDAMPVPYLDNIPDVIDVSVGRQLFVDEFLIESTSLERVFHKPVKYEGNPILSPTAKEKTSHAPGAMPKDGGVWWEPREGVYKMWYEAGWYGKTALAVSTDGLNWSRPDVNNGSNIIPSLKSMRGNSSSVVLDYDAPDAERYKMFLREPNATATDRRGWAMVSADGVNWENRTATGLCGDKSTMFYNPFRKRWVYSIRSVDLAGEPYGRARYYREHPDFLAGADWNDDDVAFWCQADYDDKPDPEFNLRPQLYNLQAVAYESVMLSMHQILMDEKTVSGNDGLPKITELKVGFSRDGFHWHRPFRDVFIAADRSSDSSWERGYIQSVGGVCGVYGDELRFYYIGFSKIQSGYDTSTGRTGVAILRRDGFASMETSGEGSLTTRKLQSDAPCELFVNVDCPAGELKAELLDAEGNVIPGFSFADCEPLSIDSTIARITWNGAGCNGAAGSGLAAGTPFKIRFNLKNGKLYAFWLSPSVNGESRGYVGAGGPGYTSNIDDKGTVAYPK